MPSAVVHVGSRLGSPRMVTGPSEEVHVRVAPGEAKGLPENVVRPHVARVVPEGQEVVLRFREGVFLTGKVLDAKGKAVMGAVVTLMTRDGAWSSGTALTDEGGRFRIAGVPGAEHRLNAFHRSRDGVMFAGALNAVVPEEGEVEVKLQRVN